MTKPLTTAAALQLVERGDLRLDGPAEDVLPELRWIAVLEGFDERGEPRLRAPRATLTLRHLLTHTSGFGYEIWSGDIRRYQRATNTPSIFTSRNAALNVPLLCDPGQQWIYGIGIDWVGKMVERVTGQSLGDRLAQELFEPLGMSDTSFKLSSSQLSRLATMHRRGEDGALVVAPFVFEQRPEFDQGGGGLYSTLRDYGRFTRMILGRGQLGGRSVLQPDTVQMMMSNQIGRLVCVEATTVMPEYSNDWDLFEGTTHKWGLGFSILTERGVHGRSGGSIGWAGLSNCYFWVDASADIAAVFLMQLFPFCDARALSFIRACEEEIYREVGGVTAAG